MTKRIIIVSITLVLSFGLRMWVNAAPLTPKRESLTSFPAKIDSWQMVGEQSLSDPITGVLKADDYVLRSYRDEQAGQQVDFFVAYYRTQKAGESMHSPKNCLPGWGWQILKTDEVPLRPEDAAHPTMINRYLVEKTGERSLVLYWYQANGRVIASEYWGKIYLVMDALRTGRRDGAIVRFVVPIPRGSDGQREFAAGMKMARAAAPLLPRYLPD
ncbi:MAG TPA: EpsI family protein [Terriglobales bacterium]|nr:EpsI family protein [Terriglobales bacterium]